MNTESEEVKTIALKLFYQLSLLQRGTESSDIQSNLALFRIIHNMSSFGLSCEEIKDLKQRFKEMCDEDYPKINISSDLKELSKFQFC